MKNFLKFMKSIGIWIANLYIVFLTNGTRVYFFTGLGHWWFAKKYADRRTKLTKTKVGGRRRHFVLPAANEGLVVLSKNEIEDLQKRKVLPRKIDIVYLLKNAYYISK